MLEVSVDRFDDSRGVLIWGLVGMPAIARPTAKAQHVFLNGRLIRDRTVQHAIKEAYRGLIEPGRHPTAVLVIEMSPDAVDVNVHPAKLEVRFRDQSMVHSAILRGVRDALRRADLTPAAPPGRIEFGPGDVDARAGLRRSGPRDAGSGGGGRAGNAFGNQFGNQIGGGIPSVDAIREAMQQASPGEIDGAFAGGFFAGGSSGATDMAAAASSHQHPAPAGWSSPKPAERVLQVHRSYLVTEDERGIVIIDQHALHERVMFEKLLERLDRGNGVLESQGMLTPIVVDAEPRQVDALDDLKPLFDRLGIEAEAMGPRSVGVRVPDPAHRAGRRPRRVHGGPPPAARARRLRPRRRGGACTRSST